MEKQKPTGESLDAYVEDIERGLMKVHESREWKGIFGNRSVVLDIGDVLESPYLRVLRYDASEVNLNSIEDVVRSVANNGRKANIEVNLHKAHEVSERLEKALERLYSGDRGVRVLRHNLHYYREGLQQGTYTFEASYTTLSHTLYRIANCALSDSTRTGRKVRAVLNTEISFGMGYIGQNAGQRFKRLCKRVNEWKCSYTCWRIFRKYGYGGEAHLDAYIADRIIEQGAVTRLKALY